MSPTKTKKPDPKVDPITDDDTTDDDTDHEHDDDGGDETLDPAQKKQIVDEVMTAVRRQLDKLIGRDGTGGGDDDDTNDDSSDDTKPKTARQEEETMAQLVKRLVGEHEADKDHEAQHEIIRKVLEEAPESTTKLQRWLWG